MKGRREDGEARGKHDSIVLGSITVERRLKTKMKLLSLLIIFFSVLLYYLVKARDTALGVVAERFERQLALSYRRK